MRLPAMAMAFWMDGREAIMTFDSQGVFFMGLYWIEGLKPTTWAVDQRCALFECAYRDIEILERRSIESQCLNI